jgi:uncharacterized membrane protein YphA (DoxX/SURF4 family)
MTTALWIVQTLLALAFIAAGSMKLAKSREELMANPNMRWAEDFPGAFIKLIGTAEVAGGLGLVLPGLTATLPLLTVVAAIGLTAIMLGAVATHIRRSELPVAVPSLVLMALSSFVVIGRLAGPI